MTPAATGGSAPPKRPREIRGQRPPVYILRHRESGRVLASRCRLAQTFWARLRGWIGHRPGRGEALWLRPCAAVHTIGMEAAIDVVLLGRCGEVRRVLVALPPGRLVGGPGVTEVCELPAGTAAGIAPGDHLDRAPSRGAHPLDERPG